MEINIKFKNIISTIFYILTFIIIFNYIRNFNNNIKIINNSNDKSQIDNFNNITTTTTNPTTTQRIYANMYDSGPYVCLSYTNANKLGYANELETNENKHFDDMIYKYTDGTKYKEQITNEKLSEYENFVKKTQELNDIYSGEELLNEKTKLYNEYISNSKFKERTYLETVNVEPHNDPIKLTDKLPLKREKLMDEQLKRHYLKLNMDYKRMGEDDKLFLEKYDWLNKMGHQLQLPDDFNLKTSNDDILNYRKMNNGRMPQEILTDYNPIIMGCQRLTDECVSRNPDKNEFNFSLKPYTEEDYNEYLENILNKDTTKKYYEILGLE